MLQHSLCAELLIVWRVLNTKFDQCKRRKKCTFYIWTVKKRTVKLLERNKYTVKLFGQLEKALPNGWTLINLESSQQTAIWLDS